MSGTPLYSGASFQIYEGEKIGLIGPNGAGKSTFLKVLCYQTPLTAGELQIGPSITCGYFGQSTIEELDSENTILQVIRSKLPQLNDGTIRNLLASFLFKGDDVFKKIRILSGGEKTRVILTFLLSTPYNCLILDEPTNHLDIKSREVFLDALERYQGTLLLVSHDRFFLRRISNRVFEVDHGYITVYEGNYSYYLEQKEQLRKINNCENA